MRAKNFNRGKHETTQAGATVDWAQQAMDMVDRRDAFSSNADHRFLLANVYASLAVRDEIRALHDALLDQAPATPAPAANGPRRPEDLPPHLQPHR
jgi:hypothetical protein